MVLTNKDRKFILTLYNNYLKSGIKPPSYPIFKSFLINKYKIKTSISTISRIINNPFKIENLSDDNSKYNTKRPMFELEINLFDKFKQMRSNGIIFTDNAMIILAKKIALDLNLQSDFCFSKGWLYNFKLKYNIKNYKISGKSDNIDLNKYEKEILSYIKIIKNYKLDSIFNFDELGLFYEKQPESSLSFKPLKNKFNSNKRLTIGLLTNFTGTRKFKPLIIHKSKKPRGVSSEFLDNNFFYYSNSTAWMSSDIFLNYLNKIDAQLSSKICLILDNFSGHKIPELIKYNNIEIVFLPPNTTSLLQFLDMGIINSFKAKFRNININNYLYYFYNNNLKYKQPFIEVLNNIIFSWNDVKNETIFNCSLKTFKNLKNHLMEKINNYKEFILKNKSKKEILEQIKECLNYIDEILLNNKNKIKEIKIDNSKDFLKELLSSKGLNENNIWINKELYYEDVFLDEIKENNLIENNDNNSVHNKYKLKSDTDEIEENKIIKSHINHNTTEIINIENNNLLADLINENIINEEIKSTKENDKFNLNKVIMKYIKYLDLILENNIILNIKESEIKLLINFKFKLIQKYIKNLKENKNIKIKDFLIYK